MVNLLLLYEFYLLAALLLSLAQIRNHLQLVRFAVRVPTRWPRIFRIVRENIHVVFTWPVISVGGVMLGIWAAAVLLRNLIFPAASVEPGDVIANVPAAIVAVAGGLVMIVIDARATFRAASFHPPRSGWLLDVTEGALAAETGRGPVRLIVEWQARRRLVAQLPFLHRWLWRRTLEITNRLTVGVALWWVWMAGA